MTDFRSAPMPSSEGRGRARQAWDAYTAATNKYVVEPLLGPAIKSVSASAVTDLLGFWLMWHLAGGFEGLRNLGMSRASVFRKVATFRRVFGVHPDEFDLPGVSIDVRAYLAAGDGDDSVDEGL